MSCAPAFTRTQSPKKTNPNFPTPSARAQTPKIKRARLLNLSREYKAPKKLKRRSILIPSFTERP